MNGPQFRSPIQALFPALTPPAPCGSQPYLLFFEVKPFRGVLIMPENDGPLRRMWTMAPLAFVFPGRPGGFAIGCKLACDQEKRTGQGDGNRGDYIGEGLAVPQT